MNNVLKYYGLFSGEVGESRALGESGAFAAPFKVKSIVTPPEGVKLSKVQKSAIVKSLAGKPVEFTGSSEWIPEPGEAIARVELVEYASRSGTNVCRLQAVRPFEGLSADEKDELMGLI